METGAEEGARAPAHPIAGEDHLVAAVEGKSRKAVGQERRKVTAMVSGQMEAAADRSGVEHSWGGSFVEAKRLGQAVGFGAGAEAVHDRATVAGAVDSRLGPAVGAEEEDIDLSVEDRMVAVPGAGEAVGDNRRGPGPGSLA